MMSAADEEVHRVAVFFYGLFMDADALRERGLDPRDVRSASVHGAALRIGRRAALVPAPLACVPGVVMRLNPRELDELYGHPEVADYRPEAMLATLADGTLLPVLSYNLPRVPTSDERNAEYETRLRALLERLGLPTQHVGEAR